MRLYRVTKTLYEMLKARGFFVSDEDLNLTLDRFRETRCQRIDGDAGAGAQSGWILRPRESLFIAAKKEQDDKDGIYVFFPEEKKMGIAPIKKYWERMTQSDVKRAIIVVQDTPTPFAKQAIAAIQQQQGLQLEYFHENELIVNITKHELVPKHIPLSDEEKKRFLSQYKLKEKDLPRIQQADPIARYFGMKKGQMFQIIRPSETAGTYVTYRVVI